MAFVFHAGEDFYDHSDTFFLFLCRKDFNTFDKPFFVTFRDLFFWKYLADVLLSIFMRMEKMNIKRQTFLESPTQKDLMLPIKWR